MIQTVNFWVQKGGRKKEHQLYESDEEGGRRVGGTKEKDKHMPPGSFAQRLCSMLMLVPNFGLELA